MESKSIIIFTAFFPPHIGGVERFSWHLAKNLIKMGHKVAVATSDSGSNGGFETIEGIDVYRLPSWNIIGGRFPIPKFNKLGRILLYKIKAISADYYILNMRFYPLSILGAITAKKKNIPAILIEHATGHFTVNNKLFDLLGHIYEHAATKYIKNKVSLFFGVSESCGSWLKHFSIVSKGVVYNGVELNENYEISNFFSEKYKLPEGAIVFTYAGRLIQEKGILYLTDAFEKIILNYKEAFLFIAGDGELLKKIKDLYKLNKNIIITGALSHKEVMELLSVSDVVVNPSYYPEGMPTIILEAGLNSCAVISTPMGGAPEIIKNDNYGMIIETKSSANIYSSIERMIKDKEYRQAAAKNLHGLVISEFGWEKISEKFLNDIAANVEKNAERIRK